MIAFYTDFFYNVIIAWSIYYLYASFSSVLPWTTCGNSWNKDTCFDSHLGPGKNLSTNITRLNVTLPNSTFPADEYYKYVSL